MINGTNRGSDVVLATLFLISPFRGNRCNYLDGKNKLFLLYLFHCFLRHIRMLVVLMADNGFCSITQCQEAASLEKPVNMFIIQENSKITQCS